MCDLDLNEPTGSVFQSFFLTHPFLKVVICSYFAHHLNVFSVASEVHLQTLEDRWSLLSLRTAALTNTGGYLVVANYSEAQHAPYLTLWDTKQGRVCKHQRLISCLLF